MDWITKLLLAVIAAGIWVNAITNMDQRTEMHEINLRIADHLDTTRDIAEGHCTNSKLC